MIVLTIRYSTFGALCLFMLTINLIGSVILLCRVLEAYSMASLLDSRNYGCPFELRSN